MKKKFTQYFKPLKFRVNSTRGEVFLKKEDLHYFIRLHKWEHFDSNVTYFFKFGVNINSPFNQTCTPFEHSVYLGDFCYGAEKYDQWHEYNFYSMLAKAKEVAIPWIEEMMNLDNLIEHIEWRINEGIRWVEPEQISREESELCAASREINSLFGASGNQICHNWVKRFYLPLAIIHNVNGNPKNALDCIKTYLDHIQGETFRDNEIKAINEHIRQNSWPKSN